METRSKDPLKQPTGRGPLVRWLRRLAILTVTVVVLFGGYYSWWALFGYRVVTVAEGAVYQSAQMPPDKLVEWCRENGVGAVVDFRETEDDIAAQRKALDAAGLRYISLPCPQIPSDDTVNAFLDAMKECRDTPVLLHCQHGEGRSVLFGALYGIEFLGWTKDEAWHKTVRLPDELKWADFERLRLAKGKKDYLFGYHKRGAYAEAPTSKPSPKQAPKGTGSNR